MTDQIKFGINFRGHWDTYTFNEVGEFIENASGLGSEDLKTRYIAFLDSFLDKKVKPSTLVDVDVLECFHGDIDNRASIDYLEGNVDPYEWPEGYAGGRYFHQISKKLGAHIEANKPEPELTWRDIGDILEYNNSGQRLQDEVNASETIANFYNKART